MADPRRPEVVNYVIDALKRGCKGVKTYPNLGYFPYDKRLYPVYEYCQANNVPILTHCSPSNPVYYRGDGIAELLKESRFPDVITKGKNKKRRVQILKG
jgi:predicted TIM-barrel fold metal-dependent hydrolase